MDTLGERLNYVRKKNGYTQKGLGEAIGVSRGVIYNLEKNKTAPQAIVINALCQHLNVSRDWLLYNVGGMEDTSDLPLKTKILAELYQIIRELSEEEQAYLLNVAKSLHH